MSVTVVDFRYPGRVSSEQAAPLTDLVVAALRAVSQRPIPLSAYLTPIDRPPTRGNMVELKWILDHFALWDARHVWLWADGTAGFFEQWWLVPGAIRLWSDVSTDNIDPAGIPAPLVVHGFNCERDVPEALHSVAHTAERVWEYLDHAAFAAYVGRGDDPFDTYRTPLDQPVAIFTGGRGNIHVPPGSSRHYEYDGPSSERWNATQEGFMRWWLGGLPSSVWEALQL